MDRKKQFCTFLTSKIVQFFVFALFNVSKLQFGPFLVGQNFKFAVYFCFLKSHLRKCQIVCQFSPKIQPRPSLPTILTFMWFYETKKGHTIHIFDLTKSFYDIGLTKYIFFLGCFFRARNWAQEQLDLGSSVVWKFSLFFFTFLLPCFLACLALLLLPRTLTIKFGRLGRQGHRGFVKKTHEFEMFSRKILKREEWQGLRADLKDGMVLNWWNFG